MLHTAFRSHITLNSPPTTREEYSSRRSSKIDAIIDIIMYHQAERGSPPLAFTQQSTPDDSGRLNLPSPTQWDELSPNGITDADAPITPDKIVLYIAFPEHNPFLKAVSLHESLPHLICSSNLGVDSA